jgi:SAM-dependent methyltransferase
MSKVKAQYEAYPYPARDPAEEKTRLITGSPSLPQEVDHFLFSGARDWSKPLRILVAGGGTGDGLIQITALLTQYGKPYEAVYVDLSTASRKIAEARAKMRGLKNIRFVTGSLLDAPELGQFDYIDCCGVLHHLPDPDAGFAALRAALAPGGGMGFMVYAPYGRSGVYPLQEAFGTLYGDLPPEARLKAAQKLMGRIPDGHPFKSNPNLNDHKSGDAGFYDLLLHSQDRAYDLLALRDVMERTGWSFVGFPVQAHYDLSRLTEVPEGLDSWKAMAAMEKLLGTIRTHTAYTCASDAPRAPASGKSRGAIPHLKGVGATQLARSVAQGRKVTVGSDGLSEDLILPREADAVIAAINGRRSLDEIAGHARLDPFAFGALWAKIEARLLPWGMLLYSTLLR